MENITVKCGKKDVTFKINVKKNHSFSVTEINSNDVVLSGWLTEEGHTFEFMDRSILFFLKELEEKISEILK